jgi:dephospho-CoA kinase
VKLIGLTGGIGAGKSTVSERLQARGAVIVDADKITKELQQPGTPVFTAMVERLGPGIVAADGTLDRPAIASIVFNDAEALTALNAIVHPAVGIEIFRRIEEEKGTDHVVVLDIPLLQRGGLYNVAGVIVVDTPIDVAVKRLVTHRGFSEADARARIANQLTREKRLEQADLVIENGGTPADLEPQIERTWTWITSLPDWAPLAPKEKDDEGKGAAGKEDQAEHDAGHAP